MNDLINKAWDLEAMIQKKHKNTLCYVGSYQTFVGMNGNCVSAYTIIKGARIDFYYETTSNKVIIDKFAGGTLYNIPYEIVNGRIKIQKSISSLFKK